ncbi:hypothetical protein AXI76_gp092 [Pseudoalteromonas phage H101]|uniref:Uncharacterized protein n=1 Tax=Pseudoalteromonas phage H101 TaxID=1654919 RepID=A0A0H4IRT1_9CAUD|nr:hypothetical protein AXI76_gp092 [Pseudoalteromonas phage H101]AKO60993.1 hypothetical protein [Pseudoalteromonas phage H101]
MKTLSAKTVVRTNKFINEADQDGLAIIKSGAKKALQERDPNGTQYAIALLELELISKL